METEESHRNNYFSSEKNDENLSINHYNKEELNEKQDLKNSRIETNLSLRKKKLNEYISEKRKKYMNYIGDNDVYINIEFVKLNVPALLKEEFDIYEEKLSVCHQFLNNDFTLLHGMDFNPESVKLYILHKLIILSNEGNEQLFGDKFENYLNEVFNDIIKLINESKNIKVLFGSTVVLVNFLYYSKKLNEQFMKLNGIWKRFQEISELKNSELNDNLMKIMINNYISIPNVGKEYILSNYSRYTKQILSNYLKEFDNDSKKDKIDLDLYECGITLIRRLISKENIEVKKENNLDVVVKLKYLYNDLVKMFTSAISWIINGISIENNIKIYDFIYNLLEVFSSIAQYANQETYEMKDFQDNYFVSSIFSLLKLLILNKNKELENELTLKIIYEIYNFLSLIFCFDSVVTEIYSQNKIIILTVELIKVIGLNKEKLLFKIIFFLSNYADNKERCSEIFEDNIILLSLKEYSNKYINDHHNCFNLFSLLENGFNMGDEKCKEIIINNFTYFLEERIKILSEFIINDKYSKAFNSKCKLLLSIIFFLEIDEQNYSALLKNLIIFLQNSNLEEYLTKVQTNAKNAEQEIISNLIAKISLKSFKI